MQTNPLGTCPEISSGTTAALLLKHNRPGQVSTITGDWRSCAVEWLAERSTVQALHRIRFNAIATELRRSLVLVSVEIVYRRV
jgi:hypothetical protein